jgi:outer membrane protein OmpA-like peptidoglycan-associated protein
MKFFRLAAALALLAIVPTVVSAQAQRSAIARSDVLSQISMFNYRVGPKSDLFLRATPIIQTGEGTVEVEYQDGNARISAEVERLPAPTTLGPYTTYVLWALTPDGRAANQGVLAGEAGGRGQLETQHGASQFALIVTAEPHFAVSVPSTMIVLYNVADDVKGAESKVTTLVEQSDYSALAPISINPSTRPATLVQAEYAVAIARAAGADQYAARLFTTAQQRFTEAQASATDRRSSERRRAQDLAREVVIAAEDARRAAIVARAAAEAEASRQAAAAAAAAAEREVAAAARQRAEAAAAEAAAAARVAAEAAAQSAAAEAAARATAAARLELVNRLNTALPTRETDRGLVSEIGGVQFATGTADLNAPARESLARFAGVVASYPDLRFMVEGHTDNVGQDSTNNELSLRRAITVRDYLITQGVAASSIDVQGFGPSQPIGDNTTADGRARNRRVEIVLSGGLLATQ